jgi:hypothetical protein
LSEVSGDYRRLFSESFSLPELTRVPILEEVIRLADLARDIGFGFQSREELMSSALFSGQIEKTLAAFAWCLAHCDGDPERFPETRMLWQYKWVAGHLADYPEISRSRIPKTLDDLGVRFRRNSWGQRGPLHTRLICALDMGDGDLAHSTYHEWLHMPRGQGDNCAACEQDQKVRFHLFCGDDSAAFRHAEPILEGKLRCAEVPKRTLCRLLLPYFFADRIGDAVAAYRRTRSQLKPSESYITDCVAHIQFLALGGNERLAIRLFERSLPKVLSSYNLLDLMKYYLSVRLLMTVLIQSASRTRQRLRIPSHAPFFEPGGVYELEKVCSWFESEATNLALQFDQRNGNSYYSNIAIDGRGLIEARRLTPLDE